MICVESEACCSKPSRPASSDSEPARPPPTLSTGPLSRWLPMLAASQQWSTDQPRSCKPSAQSASSRPFGGLFRLSTKQKGKVSACAISDFTTDAVIDEPRRHSMQVDRPSAPSSPPFHAIRRVASHSGLSRSDDSSVSSTDSSRASSIRTPSILQTSSSSQTSSRNSSFDLVDVEQAVLLNPSSISNPIDFFDLSSSSSSSSYQHLSNSPTSDAAPFSNLCSSPADHDIFTPPEYPNITRRSSPSPREEEGHEDIPQYTCDIHIAGFMKRKLELSEPGVPARDRSWKMEYIVIRGTTLKVFKHDLITHPVEGEDVDFMAHDGAERPYFHPVCDPRHKGRKPRAGPTAPENTLIREYTLQFAEAGLATDYITRENVVRVRAEGEQFLLQVKDSKAVLDLFETLNAAINVAVDLDARCLPKFQTLPMSRRRRELLLSRQGDYQVEGALM